MGHASLPDGKAAWRVPIWRIQQKDVAKGFPLSGSPFFAVLYIA